MVISPNSLRVNLLINEGRHVNLLTHHQVVDESGLRIIKCCPMYGRLNVMAHEKPQESRRELGQHYRKLANSIHVLPRVKTKSTFFPHPCLMLML